MVKKFLFMLVLQGLTKSKVKDDFQSVLRTQVGFLFCFMQDITKCKHFVTMPLWIWSGQSLMLGSFSYRFMKQLHSCKNQWSCWKKNLKSFKDKVCGSSRITLICIPSSEPFIMYINIRILRLHCTDWKSSLAVMYQHVSILTSKILQWNLLCPSINIKYSKYVFF